MFIPSVEYETRGVVTDLIEGNVFPDCCTELDIRGLVRRCVFCEVIIENGFELSCI